PALNVVGQLAGASNNQLRNALMSAGYQDGNGSEVASSVQALYQLRQSNPEAFTSAQDIPQLIAAAPAALQPSLQRFSNPQAIAALTTTKIRPININGMQFMPGQRTVGNI